MKLDTLNKSVWLTIGILVLIGILVIGGHLVYSLYGPQRYNQGIAVGSTAAPTEKGGPSGQMLIPRLPQWIDNTQYGFIGLKIRQEEPGNSVRVYKSFSPDDAYGGFANILFIRRDGTDEHLLLERKGYIKIDHKSTYRDSAQKFLLYYVVFLDTDKDGRLGEQDSTQLCISDLDGRHFAEVTPRGTAVVDHGISPDCRQLYLLLKKARSPQAESPNDDSLEVRMYDTKLRKMSPVLLGASAIMKANAILRGK